MFTEYTSLENVLKEIIFLHYIEKDLAFKANFEFLLMKILLKIYK